MADIEGDDEDNTLNGTSGDDTISGKGGNDTIDGGAGDDTIFGGDGDDTITGGGGDDAIIGGRGNDTLTAGDSSPSDTFVIRDGDGSDTITDFDPPEPDIISFHMSELNSFQDVLDRMSMDGADTVITFDNGDSVRLLNVDTNDLTSSYFMFNTGPICIHAGSFISTPDGERRIETLRIGDEVLTLDEGPQPIRAISKQRLNFARAVDSQGPILLKAGVFGPQTPDRDLLLSPQHRIIIEDASDGEKALLAACKMLGRAGIRRTAGR
jgi:hypothetical protein